MQLLGALLCLRYSLEPLYDFLTSWGLSLIVKLPLGFSMIVKLPGASLWLWNFLCLFMIVILPGPFYDCGTSWGIFMIPGVSLWLWQFLGLFMIVTFPWPLHVFVSVTLPGSQIIVTLPVASMILILPGASRSFILTYHGTPLWFYCLHYHLNFDSEIW